MLQGTRVITNTCCKGFFEPMTSLLPTAWWVSFVRFPEGGSSASVGLGGYASVGLGGTVGVGTVVGCETVFVGTVVGDVVGEHGCTVAVAVVCTAAVAVVGVGVGGEAVGVGGEAGLVGFVGELPIAEVVYAVGHPCPYHHDLQSRLGSLPSWAYLELERMDVAAFHLEV